MAEQGETRKREGGKYSVPKTAAARERQLAKVARNRERIQNELARARAEERKLAAAVRADTRAVREKLERKVGRMLLEHIEERRARGAAGNANAQQNADYWLGRIDQAVTDPACRKMLGLPPPGGTASPAPSLTPGP